MKENNLDVTIPIMPIPKMKIAEVPGTAERLQQQYNSEQWKEVVESLNRTKETIIKTVTPVIEAVAKVVKDMYYTIMEAYSVDPEIKKCYGIYKRTKKRKDQKKANDKDKKNNREEIY